MKVSLACHMKMQTRNPLFIHKGFFFFPIFSWKEIAFNSYIICRWQGSIQSSIEYFYGPRRWPGKSKYFSPWMSNCERKVHLFLSGHNTPKDVWISYWKIPRTSNTNTRVSSTFLLHDRLETKILNLLFLLLQSYEENVFSFHLFAVT